MKQTIIATFLLFTTHVFGQTTDTLINWTLLGQSPDGTVKAFQDCDKKGNWKYILKYKNKKREETLSFADTDIGDSCKISLVQIDKKGLKEIVISWAYHNLGTYGGHGGWQTDFTTNEVWNLDM